MTEDPFGPRPELVLFVGHSAGVRDVALSPDGSLLATAGEDHIAIIWDVASGEMLHRLSEHSGTTGSLAFSPGGNLLATDSADGVRLWEAATSRWLGTLPCLRGPLSFGTDEHLLVAYERGAVVLVDLRSGERLRRLPLSYPPGRVTAVAVSPDQTEVAVATYLEGSREILVFDFASGIQREAIPPPTIPRRAWRDPHTGELQPAGTTHVSVDKIAFSPDKTMLVIGGISSSLWMLDTRTHAGEQLPIARNQGMWSMSFSPDGSALAGGASGGRLQLWNMPSGEERYSRQGHHSAVYAVGFSGDGSLLASGSADKTVCLWRTGTGELVRKLKGLEDDVFRLVFSPDGETLITGHKDGGVRFWNGRTGRLERTSGCESRAWSTMSFARDGRLLAIANCPPKGQPGTITLWDMTSPARVPQCRLRLTQGVAATVSFPEEGHLLAASRSNEGGQVTCVFDLDTGELRFEVPGKEATLSPDGRLVAVITSSYGSEVALYDTASGDRVRTMDPWHGKDSLVSLRFSADGHQLLGGYGGGGIGVWDVRTGKEVWHCGCNTAWNEAAAFSPDGSRVAVGGHYQDFLNVWDFGVRPARFTLTGHTAGLRAVDFSPDGRKIATASADGTARIWDAETGKLLVTLLVLPSDADTPSTEWIAYTPAGHYHCSPGAERFVRWRVGREWHVARELEGEFHRPEEVARALA